MTFIAESNAQHVPSFQFRKISDPENKKCLADITKIFLLEHKESLHQQFKAIKLTEANTKSHAEIYVNKACRGSLEAAALISIMSFIFTAIANDPSCKTDLIHHVAVALHHQENIIFWANKQGGWVQAFVDDRKKKEYEESERANLNKSTGTFYKVLGFAGICFFAYQGVKNREVISSVVKSTLGMKR